MKTRRQHFGQHFLRDQKAIDGILAALESELEKKTGVRVLEIGPGDGALTKPLIEKSTRFDFHVIERDLKLRDTILQFLPVEKLHFFDAASDKMREFLVSSPAKTILVSNLPYSASSQILAQLCYASRSLASAIVMVQKELADRMMAPHKTKERGAFSLFIQSYFDAKKLFEVMPGAFSPPPKVKSTVLLLTPLIEPKIPAGPKQKLFETFCKTLFSQRRKMLRNSVPDLSAKAFANLGISGTERAEDLTLDTVVALFDAIHEERPK